MEQQLALMKFTRRCVIENTIAYSICCSNVITFHAIKRIKATYNQSLFKILFHPVTMGTNFVAGKIVGQQNLTALDGSAKGGYNRL